MPYHIADIFSQWLEIETVIRTKEILLARNQRSIKPSEKGQGNDSIIAKMLVAQLLG